MIRTTALLEEFKQITEEMGNVYKKAGKTHLADLDLAQTMDVLLCYNRQVLVLQQELANRNFFIETLEAQNQDLIKALASAARIISNMCNKYNN